MDNIKNIPTYDNVFKMLHIDLITQNCPVELYISLMITIYKVIRYIS